MEREAIFKQRQKIYNNFRLFYLNSQFLFEYIKKEDVSKKDSREGRADE